MSIQASLENAGGNLQAVAPFDLVLAVDVVYTRPNVQAAPRLLPRLGRISRDGVARRSGPHRRPHLLAGARASLTPN